MPGSPHDPSPAVQRQVARQGWLIAGLVVLVTVLAYAGPFGTGFVLDDDLSVSNNPSIRQLSDLQAVFSPPPTSTLGGRPLSNLSLAVTYGLFGARPAAYRIGNLILHLAAALLIFGIVRRTLGRLCGYGADTRAAVFLAGGAALAWALHPIHTGTVLYVAQRTEVLMGVFYLLVVYSFIRGCAQGGGWRWWSVSVAACALGMLCKEGMATAPLIVLLYDWAFVAGSLRQTWHQRRNLYLALTATWLPLLLLVSGLGERAVGFGLGVTVWRYALAECQALVTYLHLAVWPYPLVFDYGPLFPGVLAALPYAVLLLAFLAFAGQTFRRSPRLGFGAVAFLAILAPTSSFIPIATQPIAESRTYVPLAALAVAAVIGTHRLLGRRLWPVGLAVLAGFLVVARARNAVLRDPLALWADTVAKRPANARAHGNLGSVLFGRGQVDAAIAEFNETLRLDPLGPAAPDAYVNLAVALNEKGRYEEALRAASFIAQAKPSVPRAHFQAGNALSHLDRHREAIPYYEAEIALTPDDYYSYSNLGTTLYLLNRPAEAIPLFEHALRLKPDFTDARSNLAAALTVVGRTDEAIAEYRRLLTENPGNATMRRNLGLALERAGRLSEAKSEFEAVLQLQPDSAEARIAVARIEKKLVR